jgi:hypothetical protein
MPSMLDGESRPSLQEIITCETESVTHEKKFQMKALRN